MYSICFCISHENYYIFMRIRDINAFPLENEVYVNGFGLEIEAD